MAFVTYPEAPSTFDEQQRQAWNSLLDALRRRDVGTFRGTTSRRGSEWLLSNVSTTYSLDPVAANTSAVAHALGTLLTDLKNKGIVS